MSLGLLAVAIVGCSQREPNPLPVSRDSRLLGRWVGQVAPNVPTFIDLNSDGTGSVSVDSDRGEVKLWSIQWGTDKGSLCLAKPTTDTGLVYEATPFQLSVDGKQVQFVGKVANYSTDRDDRIHRSRKSSRFMTSSTWQRN